jgi:hypothetical protein
VGDDGECHETVIAEDRVRIGFDPSKNVQPEHPRHKAEGDYGHDDVPEPLARGFGLGAVFHGVMVAGSHSS